MFAKDKGKYNPDSLAVTPSLYQAMEIATVGQDNIRSVVEYVKNEMNIRFQEMKKNGDLLLLNRNMMVKLYQRLNQNQFI